MVPIKSYESNITRKKNRQFRRTGCNSKMMNDLARSLGVISRWKTFSRRYDGQKLDGFSGPVARFNRTIVHQMKILEENANGDLSSDVSSPRPHYCWHMAFLLYASRPDLKRAGLEKQPGEPKTPCENFRRKCMKSTQTNSPRGQVGAQKRRVNKPDGMVRMAVIFLSGQKKLRSFTSYILHRTL